MTPGGMTVVSVNAGTPRELVWEGKTLVTAILKTPVPGRVRIDTEHLDGDAQADLSVHGGPVKAVYAYPSEHYPFWAGDLAIDDLPWGAFGENLTTSGFAETDLRSGDLLRFGTAVLRVTQPRMPCQKLNARFGRLDMGKRFLSSRRSGFYLAIVRPGEVAAGDSAELLERAENSLTVDQLTALYGAERGNADLLRRAAVLPHLGEKLRMEYRRRLDGLAGSATE